MRITQDNGQIVEGVLSYADDATQEGSAYTKGNVLPDDVCGILGIDPATSEPKDAWLGVIQAVGYSILKIEALQADGTPLANFKVEGLTGVIESKCYTDVNGKLFLIIPEGAYTLTIPEAACVDSQFPPTEAVVTAGQTTNITLQAVKNGTSATFTSSQSGLKLSGAVAKADVFCCGGGGGGGSGRNGSTGRGGGGGGGGYTKTQLNAPFTPYTAFNVVVGSGGNGGSGENAGANGLGGGSSSCLNVTAFGGGGGNRGFIGSSQPNGRGGNGGSGGGGGGTTDESGGNGGTDGLDGERGGTGEGGTGQGSTTRAFGESTGILCSGGGCGGIGNATAGDGYNGRGGNGGTGRGGTAGPGGGDGSSGNSGVVMLRWEFKP